MNAVVAALVVLTITWYLLMKSHKKRDSAEHHGRAVDRRLQAGPIGSLPPSRQDSSSKPSERGYAAISEEGLSAVPDEPVRRKLDFAHYSTFVDYMNREGLANDRSKASAAFIGLPKSLRSSHGPDYADPYIAAAYQLHYQLNHCVMAFRSFDALLADSKVSKRIYVCDVGAGALSGRIGLAMALEKRNARPQVHYCAIEPSSAMLSAGNVFLAQYFTFTGEFEDKSIEVLADGVRQPPMPPLDCDLKLVTAFHLKLKYGEQPSRASVRSDNASRALLNALNAVQPHAFLLTCHASKLEHLKQILDEFPQRGHYAESDLTFPQVSPTKDPSDVFTELAPHYGFQYPDGDDGSVTDRWQWRFGMPKEATLVSGLRK